MLEFFKLNRVDAVRATGCNDVNRGCANESGGAEMTMTSRYGHRISSLFGFAVMTLLLVAAPLSSADENEAIGFSPNHVFESAINGENVDVLNGNVNLRIPIGQRFMLNDWFGYQIQLYYNSKIWRIETKNSAFANGPDWYGRGVTLHFGRIYHDPMDLDGVYHYETPDGSDHVFCVQAAGSNNCAGPFNRTFDAGSIKIEEADDGWLVWPGDGTLITMANDAHDKTYNRDDQPWGGWYTTRIETMAKTSGGVAQHSVDFYYVYEAGATSTRKLDRIQDSSDRLIDFNGTSITMPAVGTTTGTTTATYTLSLQSAPVTVPILDPDATEVEQPTPLLKEIQFPLTSVQVPPHKFGHNTFGVMTTWTLPTGAKMDYVYDHYATGPWAPFHSHLVSKKLETQPGESYTWTYTRTGSGERPFAPGGLPEDILTSNPIKVRVLDPLGNLTVYDFEATINCPSAGCTDDWKRGLLKSVNEYAGPNENSNRLVRRQANSYIYDEEQVELQWGSPAVKRAPVNVRTAASASYTYGGPTGWTSRKSVRGDWAHLDASGSVPVPMPRETLEYIDGDLYRRTFTNYQPTDWFHGHHDYVEVTDANGIVVSRTDKGYMGNRLKCQIRRFSGSSTASSCLTVELDPGDVFLVNEYDSETGNLVARTTSGGDTVSSSTTHFTYKSGTLETKSYGDLTWKAVERDIDAETGLVTASYLPPGRDSGVSTDYTWDALGRLTRITPQSPEIETVIDYPSLHETRVNQAIDAGNFTESVFLYDTLGRVIEEQRRTIDGLYDYRRTEYDIAGRVERQSEWASDGTDPEDLVWTTFEYQYADTSFIDPLGRISKVTRPDGSATTTTYDGLSTSVTIQGIHGLAGTALDATTTYFNDPLGRLIDVDSPDGADAHYEYDERDKLVEVQLVEPTSPFFVQTRRFEYDRLGRLRLATNPENGTVDYLSYDARGNLVSYQDARDNTFHSTYDDAGRLRVRRLNGAAGPRLVENVYDGYDDTGLVSDGSTLGKQTHQYSYRIDHVGGLPVETLVSTHSYGYGAQTTCTAGFQGDTSYSGLNSRLAWTRTKIEPWTETLETRYCQDPMGLAHSTTYPDFDNSGNTRSDVRTARQNGHVWEMHDLGREVQYFRDVVYGPHGAPIQFTRGNGVLNFIVRDEQGRPLEFSVWLADQPLGQPPFETVMGCGQQGGSDPLDFQQCNGPTPEVPPIPQGIVWDTGSYMYDGAGNVQSIGMNIYEYDGLNRIVGGTAAGAGTLYDLLYQYDAFGNMTSRRKDSGAVSVVDAYEVDMLSNRLKSHTRFDSSGSSATDIAYDPSGNMREAGDDRYVFDEQNRLREIWDQSVNLVASYDYDASGYRVRAVRNGSETFFFRDSSGALLSEFSWAVDDDRDPAEQPAWNKDYIYGLGQQLVMHKNQAPNQPFGLWASNVSSAGLTLNWSIVVEPDLRNFLITRRVDDGSPTIFGKKDYDRDLLDDFAGVPAGSTVVTYSIAAYDMAGNASTASPTLTLRPFSTDTPPKPENLVAVGLDGAVRLTWDPVDGGDDFWGYRVERLGPWGQLHPTPTVWEQVPGLPVPEPIYLDIGMTNGDEWDYRVVAVNTSGRASAPSNVDRVRPYDEVAPARPVGVTVVPGLEAGSLTVSWLPVLEPDIAYYVVTFTPGGYPIPVAPDEFHYTEGGLLEAAAYSFTVRVVDTSGNYADSDEVFGTTRTSTVTSPTGVTADFYVDTGVNQIPDPVWPNDCYVSQEYDDTLGVRVIWNAVTDADEYRIYRALGQGAAYQLVGIVPDDSVQTSFEFFDVDPPAYDYTYYVTTEDGGDESPASSLIHVEGSFDVTASVRNLRATDSRAGFDVLMDNRRSREVYLEWTPVLEPGLQGYHVYRRAPWTSCSGWDNLQTHNTPHTWVRLSESPVTTPNFTDSTVGGLGGCWNYIVRPVGPAGEEGGINKVLRVDLHEHGYVGEDDLIGLASPPMCLDAVGVDIHTKGHPNPPLYLEAPWETERIPAISRGAGSADGPPSAPLLHPRAYPEYFFHVGRIVDPSDYPVGYYATVRWHPNAESDLRGYYIEKSESTEGPWQRLTPEPLAWWETRFDDKSPWNVFDDFPIVECAVYRVIAVDEEGLESSPSLPFPLLSEETSLYSQSPLIDCSRPTGATDASPTLPAPQNLLASPDYYADDVKLTWDAVDDAVKYNVYRFVFGFDEWDRYYVKFRVTHVEPDTNCAVEPGGDGVRRCSFLQTVGNVDLNAYYITAVGQGFQISVHNPDDATIEPGSPRSETVFWKGGLPDGYASNSPAPSGVIQEFFAGLGGSVDPVIDGVCDLGLDWNPSDPAALLVSQVAPTLSSGIEPLQAPLVTLGQVGAYPAYDMYDLHVDHLGSTRLVTTEVGTVASRHDFFPFGEEIAPVFDYNTKMFTGHERDGETGLDYMLARYSGSTLGRFLAVDQSRRSVRRGFPQSWNRYAYVYDNPLRFNDPNGWEPKEYNPFPDVGRTPGWQGTPAGQKTLGAIRTAAKLFQKLAPVIDFAMWESPIGKDEKIYLIDDEWVGPAPDWSVWLNQDSGLIWDASEDFANGDLDGDGTKNGEDADIDGDGIPNLRDPEPVTLERPEKEKTEESGSGENKYGIDPDGPYGPRPHPCQGKLMCRS